MDRYHYIPLPPIAEICSTPHRGLVIEQELVSDEAAQTSPMRNCRLC